MRDCWRIEILRLRTAALIRIITRTFSFLCHWRCRNGRCLRSCLARSSRRPSCKPVPWRSLQTFTRSARFWLCVWNSFHCLCGVHSHLVREEIFIGFRGLVKPYSTDKSRICSTLPDSVPNPSTGEHDYTEQSFPPWYGFPKQSSNAVFFLLPFACCFSSNHPACLTNHGHTSMACVTSIESETLASNLTFHCVLCSPNCTDALTAESWCCLNLELNSVRASPHCDLVCQQLQRGFWINLRSCFRIRHPFDECSAHR